MSYPMPRLLELFAPRDSPWEASGLIAFRSLLLLHSAVRTWMWLPSPLPGGAFGPAIVLGIRVLVTIMAVASLWPARGRLASALAAALVFSQVILSFPDVGDHMYLELFGLALYALLDPQSTDDGPWLRSTLCWMGAIVLFHSGLQKLLHGYYFFAEFPLWAIATKDPVGDLYAWLLSATEVARLRGLNMFLPESGPFRTASVPLILMSNGVWALEIELAVMMLFHRTRRFAAIAAIVTVVILQVAGHQPLVALLLPQLFLLCIPGQWNRRLAYVLVVAYVAILLARFGLFSKALLLREAPL